MAEVKAKHLAVVNGSFLFHASQLLELSGFFVTQEEQAIATPQWRPPQVNAPVRPPGGSPAASAQSQDLLEPKKGGERA